MAFQSQLYDNEIIFDDDTPVESTQAPEGMSKGLRLGMRTTPFGEMKNAIPFPSELLVPRSEWEERIKEMEERKTRLSDLALHYGLPCKDQNGTNYCWINAPTHCIELIRLLQNQIVVILSPASGGARIKNFRNVGGWGEEALDFIEEHGLCPIEKWPANAIDRKYDTAENRELAKKYRQLEWYELRPRNIDEMMSAGLHRMPQAKGYNWWSHETTGYDPLWLDGQPAYRDRNSWAMSYGDKGFFTLKGSKMLADDIVIPVLVLPGS